MKWVTACRPPVDRCASASFVRTFVDPDATFLSVREGNRYRGTPSPTTDRTGGSGIGTAG